MEHGQAEVNLHGLQKPGSTDTRFPAKSPSPDNCSPGIFSFSFSLLDNYIHGAKDLPYYIFPISFLEIGISNIREVVLGGVRHLAYALLLLLAFA